MPRMPLAWQPGLRGYLLVEYRLSDSASERVIVRLVEGSPLAAAGARAGDRWVFEHRGDRWRYFAIGEPIGITLIQGDARRQVVVAAAARPDSAEPSAIPFWPQGSFNDGAWVAVASLSSARAHRYPRPSPMPPGPAAARWPTGATQASPLARAATPARQAAAVRRHGTGEAQGRREEAGPRGDGGRRRPGDGQG